MRVTNFFPQQLLLAVLCLLIEAAAGSPAITAAPSADGTQAAPGEFQIAAPEKICCYVRHRRFWTTAGQCNKVHGQVVKDSYCKEGLCRDYANAAIEANQTNQRNNCGFSGPRWSADFGHHYDWCKKVPSSRSSSDTLARNRQLASCKGKMRYCRGYADGAILANRTNKRKGCGFTGPRWRSEFDHHYDWCMNVARAKSRSETRARRDQLLKNC